MTQKTNSKAVKAAVLDIEVYANRSRIALSAETDRGFIELHLSPEKAKELAAQLAQL